MKSGELRYRVTLQSHSQTQDSTGEILRTWVDVAPVWASIRFVSGISAIKADMDVSTVKASIRIRYRTGISAGMRVLHGGDVYEVQAVMPNMAGRYIDLVCEVKNAAS